MAKSDERQDFSARLKIALSKANYSPDSPTKLSREFNVRFTGHPITVHAARKWLFGEAIPTKEKVRLLSQWLGVPADWLRFGDLDQSKGEVHNPSPKFASSDVRLIAELQTLDEKSQTIAREIIRLLIHLNGVK